MFGVRFGLTCSNRAAAPATTGAATDVPLKYITRLFGSVSKPALNSGCKVTIAFPSDSA